MNVFRLPDTLLTKRMNVAVVGCGGTGSFLASELIKIDYSLKALHPDSGLEVSFFDGSQVSKTNLVRQDFFQTQVGENKAMATVWKCNALHGRNWKGYAENFDPHKCNLRDFDMVITCLDKPSTRHELYQVLRARYQPMLWLDLGNDHDSCQVVLGEVSRHDERLPSICDLYDYSQLSDEDALIKSCSAEQSLQRQDLGVNATCARLGAQLIWNIIRHGELTVHGAHINVRTLESTPIPIDVQAWELIYGYQFKDEEIHDTETA